MSDQSGEWPDRVGSDVHSIPRHHIRFPRTSSGDFDWARDVVLEIDAIAELMLGYRGDGLSGPSVRALGLFLAQNSDCLEDRLQSLVSPEVFAEHLVDVGKREVATP